MRYLLALSAALVLSGCGVFGQKDGAEPKELEPLESSAHLELLWTRKSTDGQGDGYTRLTPAIGDELIYLADHRGELVALDRDSGRVQWRQDSDEELAGGVGLGEELLLVSNFQGQVLGLSREAGQEQWRTQLSSEIMSIPRTNDRIVAVQTINGRIYALNAESGEIEWFYQSPPPSLTMRGTASPILTDNTVYAGFANGRMMAFEARNGLIRWEERIAMPSGRSDLERMIDIHGSPVLKDDVFYVGTYQGRVGALSRGSGRGLWAQDASTLSAPAVAEDSLYVTMSDGEVAAMRAGTGEILWRNNDLLRRGVSNPVVLGDYAVVIDYQSYIHLIDRSDGTLAGRVRVAGGTSSGKASPPRAPLQVADGVLYIYGDDGRMRALTLAD